MRLFTLVEVSIPAIKVLRSFCTALFSSLLLQETWEKVVRIKICNRSLERSIKLDQLLIGVSQVLDTKSGVTNLFYFPRH